MSIHGDIGRCGVITQIRVDSIHQFFFFRKYLQSWFIVVSDTSIVKTFVFSRCSLTSALSYICYSWIVSISEEHFSFISPLRCSVWIGIQNV